MNVEAAPGEPLDHGRFETVLEPIATVVGLTTKSRGLWSDSEGKRRLRIL